MPDTNYGLPTKTRNPELKLIGVADLQEKLSISRSTVYRLTANEDFPRPLKIGRAVRWPEHLVDGWLERQMVASAAIGGRSA